MIHMVDSAVSYYIAVYGSGVLFSIHEIEWVANVELQCLTPAVSGLQPLACEVCSGCRVSATSQVCCCNLQWMLRELWVVISYCCGYLDLWLRDLWVVLMSAMPWVCAKTWEQVNVVSVHTTKLREGKGRWLAHGWSYGWEQIYSTPFTLFSCNQPIVTSSCIAAHGWSIFLSQQINTSHGQPKRCIVARLQIIVARLQIGRACTRKRWW